MSTAPSTANCETASGVPVPGQPLATPANLPPLATVTHTQYPPPPATGIPVRPSDGNPFYPSAPTGTSGYDDRGAPVRGSQRPYGFTPGAGQQAFMMGDGTTVVISEGSVSIEHAVARSAAFSLRFFAIIDLLLCLLYVFSGYLLAAIATIGPLCGYYGSKNYSSPHVLSYAVFCVCNLVWRIASLFVARSVGTQVLGFLLVLVEVYITRLAVRFYRLLKAFSEEDIAMLRAMEQLPMQMGYFWR